MGTTNDPKLYMWTSNEKALKSKESEPIHADHTNTLYNSKGEGRGVAHVTKVMLRWPSIQTGG